MEGEAIEALEYSMECPNNYQRSCGIQNFQKMATNILYHKSRRRFSAQFILETINDSCKKE